MEDRSGPSWENVHAGVEAVIGRWDDAVARIFDEKAAQQTVREYLVDFVFPHADSPEDEAAFLFMLAWRFAELGRFADDLTVLEWIAELYAGQTDGDVAVAVLMTLADVAMELAPRYVDPDRVVAILNRAVDQVASDVSPAIERAACRALAYGAILTSTVPMADGDRGIRRQAEPWRMIIDRWSGSGDAVLRWRLAQAHFHIGLVHLLLGEEASADDRFARAAMQSNGLAINVAAGEGLDTEYFARGEYARRILRAVELPGRAAHLTPELLLSPAANRQERGRERHQAKALVRAAQRRHRRSVGDVKTWCCCGAPFALLLRNFGLLESTIRLPRADHGDGQGFHQAQTYTYARRGDHVVRELGREVDIVQVATSQSANLELDPWRFHGEPLSQAQLYLTDDSWLDTVTHVITLAETIIIWAEGMTPALAQEMAAVRHQGRTQDTVVLIEEVNHDLIQGAGVAAILATEIAEEGGYGDDAWRSIADAMTPHLAPSREQLTPESPALTGFPYVVDLRNAPEEGSAQHPAVLARRQHHQRLWELPWDERMARLSRRLGE
ncbi:hypothetical protein ABT072_44915 [Streptomyces sp. NPDC002589]|uniref:hypothetical protein n=1 Tax=Streptomyces sp. NPDC002589 TaxID=3154420 RepID=UPI0033279198